MTVQDKDNTKTEQFFGTEHLMADLKERSLRGGAITMVSQAARFCLRMISTVVLARLLTPKDFGIIAMVTAITNLAMKFNNLGLSMATIQKERINHMQISALFWINVGLGLVIAAALVALAPMVAWFYREPRLTPITIALAGTFIFGGLTVQHQALLRRHMRFLALGLITTVAMAIGVTVAIVAGFYGAGYWSLVTMELVITAVTAVGVWIAFPWKPGIPKRRVGVTEMLGFGGNVMGFNLVNYFARNADNILLGKFWGARSVGFYSRAYSILMLPINQIRNPLQAVAMPGLCRLQNQPARFRRYYLRFVSLLAFITMPLIVFLFVRSEDLIELILGEQWLPATRIFQILAVAGFMQPVLGTLGGVLLALGQSKRYLKWGLFSSLIIVMSFVVGLPAGAEGIATSYAIANYFLVLLSLWYCFRFTPVSAKSFLGAIWRPAVMSIVMGLFVAVYHAWLADSSLFLTWIVSFVLACLVYLVCWFLVPTGKECLSEYCSHIHGVFNGRNVQ